MSQSRNNNNNPDFNLVDLQSNIAFLPNQDDFAHVRDLIENQAKKPGSYIIFESKGENFIGVKNNSGKMRLFDLSHMTSLLASENVYSNDKSEVNNIPFIERLRREAREKAQEQARIRNDPKAKEEARINKELKLQEIALQIVEEIKLAGVELTTPLPVNPAILKLPYFFPFNADLNQKNIPTKVQLPENSYFITNQENGRLEAYLKEDGEFKKMELMPGEKINEVVSALKDRGLNEFTHNQFQQTISQNNNATPNRPRANAMPSQNTPVQLVTKFLDDAIGTKNLPKTTIENFNKIKTTLNEANIEDAIKKIDAALNVKPQAHTVQNKGFLGVLFTQKEKYSLPSKVITDLKNQFASLKENLAKLLVTSTRRTP